jgi:sterol desaturase/sphingolipid hydroxylase (fatty acid hydroxylase superfamily)
MTTLPPDAPPIRIFKSPFVEAFTHFTPLGVIILWAPVITFCAWRGYVSPMTHTQWALALIIGLFSWTFVEYLLHRYLFHGKFKTQFMLRFQYLGHGIHHEQPMMKTRLVMPPLGAIPTAAVIYGIYYLIVGVLIGAPDWVNPLFAGMMVGYVIYDQLHYAYHHANLKGKWMMMMRKHHMRHHAVEPDKRFGVSTPFWDYIFGTQPKAAKEAKQA